jgi:hypothetical protein
VASSIAARCTHSPRVAATAAAVCIGEFRLGRGIIVGRVSSFQSATRQRRSRISRPAEIRRIRDRRRASAVCAAARTVIIAAPCRAALLAIISGPTVVVLVAHGTACAAATVL